MQQTLREVACNRKAYLHSEMAIGPKDYPLLWWLVGLQTIEERRVKPNLTLSENR